MSKKYDLHLSAYSISPETITVVESLGFRRDKFANSRYCDTTVYHATYRGDSRLPDDVLWQNLRVVLAQDSSFVGGLEEEECVQEEVLRFSATEVSEGKPVSVEKLPFHHCTANEYKACDIHLNVTLVESSAAAIEYVASMEFTSFDKLEADGVHRVFSATCESLEGGMKLFRFLCGVLETVPDLNAKMKFERTTRFVRYPSAAPALPLLSDSDLETWLRRLAEVT